MDINQKVQNNLAAFNSFSEMRNTLQGIGKNYVHLDQGENGVDVTRRTSGGFGRWRAEHFIGRSEKERNQQTVDSLRTAIRGMADLPKDTLAAIDGRLSRFQDTGRPLSGRAAAAILDDALNAAKNSFREQRVNANLARDLANGLRVDNLMTLANREGLNLGDPFRTEKASFLLPDVKRLVEKRLLEMAEQGVRPTGEDVDRAALQAIVLKCAEQKGGALLRAMQWQGVPLRDIFRLERDVQDHVAALVPDIDVTTPFDLPATLETMCARIGLEASLDGHLDALIGLSGNDVAGQAIGRGYGSRSGAFANAMSSAGNVKLLKEALTEVLVTHAKMNPGELAKFVSVPVQGNTGTHYAQLDRALELNGEAIGKIVEECGKFMGAASSLFQAQTPEKMGDVLAGISELYLSTPVDFGSVSKIARLALELEDKAVVMPGLVKMSTAGSAWLTELSEAEQTFDSFSVNMLVNTFSSYLEDIGAGGATQAETLRKLQQEILTDAKHPEIYPLKELEHMHEPGFEPVVLLDESNRADWEPSLQRLLLKEFNIPKHKFAEDARYPDWPLRDQFLRDIARKENMYVNGTLVAPSSTGEDFRAMLPEDVTGKAASLISRFGGTTFYGINIEVGTEYSTRLSRDIYTNLHFTQAENVPGMVRVNYLGDGDYRVFMTQTQNIDAEPTEEAKRMNPPYMVRELPEKQMIKRLEFTLRTGLDVVDENMIVDPHFELVVKRKKEDHDF